ncbi:uncharacterized protein G2W53_041491 [Senna tora]|uniref:Uncharacterized protein n=1 Tax=Senna tora TaxID=362788 RepID=A0A834SH51_9FABA|nr:uncharacterized protein G2W53_041491 [Senna tora]
MDVLDAFYSFVLTLILNTQWSFHFHLFFITVKPKKLFIFSQLSLLLGFIFNGFIFSQKHRGSQPVADVPSSPVVVDASIAVVVMEHLQVHHKLQLEGKYKNMLQYKQRQNHNLMPKEQKGENQASKAPPNPTTQESMTERSDAGGVANVF